MEGGSSLELGIDGLTDVVEVARGGFSTVFRARQTILDRTVAVKLIHATVTDTAGAERFLREVKASDCHSIRTSRRSTAPAPSPGDSPT